jgi:hypothetical protein
MPELSCTARRVGDYESRTEEYELLFAVGASRGLRIRYQAARAYEINAALDAAVETARAVISESDPGLGGPTDEALSQFTWRAIQSAKYEEGEPVTSRLKL